MCQHDVNDILLDDDDDNEMLKGSELRKTTAGMMMEAEADV